MAGSASPHPPGSPSTWQVPFSLWPNLCFLPPLDHLENNKRKKIPVSRKLRTAGVESNIDGLTSISNSSNNYRSTVIGPGSDEKCYENMRLLIWRCLIRSIAGWSRGSHFPNLLASLLCPCARHSPHRSRPRCIICTPGTNLLSFDVLKSFRAPCLKFVDNLSE